ISTMAKKPFRTNECDFQTYSSPILNKSPTAKNSRIDAQSIPPTQLLFSKSGNDLLAASIPYHVATEVSKSVAGEFIRLVMNLTLAEGLELPSETYWRLTVRYSSSA